MRHVAGDSFGTTAVLVACNEIRGDVCGCDGEGEILAAVVDGRVGLIEFEGSCGARGAVYEGVLLSGGHGGRRLLGG